MFEHNPPRHITGQQNKRVRGPAMNDVLDDREYVFVHAGQRRLHHPAFVSPT